MTATRTGLQAALIAGAAALLAACAANEPTSDQTEVETAPPSAETQDPGNGPGSVPTRQVERDEVTDPFGRPTQESLDNYAGDRVFFAFDSSELSPQARRVLQRQAEWLKAHDEVDAIIEGHTDERGTREYNLALGERRANAAKNYLVALGIAENRLETLSYGKERPAVLGQGEQVWSKNRRAVLKVDTPGV